MHLKKQLPVWLFTLICATSLEVCAVASATTSPTHESVKTKSFREWKSEKVQDALTRVTVTKTKIQIAKSKDPNVARRKAGIEASSGTNSESLETQLQQDQSILEMAKDLSVTDYFVGYLTKVQDKKAAFNEVAGKLTAEEVAELMAAYANSVFGSHTSEMPPSAQDLSSDRIR
ncbi:hypothetical protein [Bdellovibrio sp. HCB337]|uniref:hypothetical protein n=1 Tax=Bdellovibrio sp. HCB337 TaxID=3394358 RepID=UPI0039A5FE97